MNIPKKTQAVVLPAYNPNLIRALLGIRIEERKIPELKPDDVLIHMAAAPCNPSDIAFLQGGYNVVKSLPVVPGFEGAGTIIDTGENQKKMIGKRISFFTQAENDGTWSEFIVTSALDCIELYDELSFEQGACLAINPLTAFGLFELALKKKSKAIIQNAAGGQLAHLISIFAKKKNIPVINIVRKQEQIDELKTRGEKHVLNSANDNFPDELNHLAQQLQAIIAFDAVGGEMSGILLNSMPANADLILYGGLSGADLSGISSLEIIFKKKNLNGFNLNEWLENKSHEEIQKISNQIQEMILAGEFKTEIQATFKLNEIINGIRTYIKSMSKGKVLFTP